MKRIAILLILILSTSIIYADKVIEFDFLLNKNESISLHTVRTFDSSIASRSPVQSKYRLVLEDEQGFPMTDISLPVHFVVLDPLQEVNETLASVKVLYFSAYRKAKIYHNEQLLFEQDLDFLCQPDGSCQEPENTISCPSDCPLSGSDRLCRRIVDGICDPDCIKGDLDCTYGKISIVWAGVLVSIVSLLSIVAGIWWIRKRRL